KRASTMRKRVPSKLVSGAGDGRGKAMMDYPEEDARARRKMLPGGYGTNRTASLSGREKVQGSRDIFRLRGFAISISTFNRMHDRARLAILASRAGVCGTAHIDLDFVINRAVEISHAGFAFEEGFKVSEFFRAGGVLRQDWPGQPAR